MSDAGAAIKVLSTTAMQKVLEPLVPEFVGRTGCRVNLHFAPSGRMASRVAEGEPTDVAIVTAGGIDALIEQGRIVRGSRTDIARSVIGLAVQRGAPVPDVSTVDGFKAALLGARAVAMSHPTGGAQSGAHLAKVFDSLGIADAMRSKSIYGPGGPAGLVGNYLLRNEAEIGLQQLPELMAVPGIEIVGPIPEEVQLVTVFSAGISTTAANPGAARQWIESLRASATVPIIRAAGMQPA